ncbi:MAG: 50S ribosomal protein L30 [Candidatus Heimdallarchaeota archaeon]|nr:50S ribosomal protein L30 [Candidatus Heimdallarchaeota archaeon]
MSQNKDKLELIAVIRLRGTVNVHFKVKENLEMLNVRRANYMTLVPNTSSYLGMLKKAKDFITWGEVNQTALEHVIAKRGELPGRTKITNKYLKDTTPFTTIKALSKAFLTGEAHFKDVPEMKRFFRLHPARKGYKTVKRGFAEGGELGYRGSAINELIVRMA